MGDARVGYACDKLDIGHRAGQHLVACHDLAVAIAHDFDIDALIVRVGITVIRPKEGADLHFLLGGRKGFAAVRCESYDLGGTEVAHPVIAELFIGEGFKADAKAVLILPDQHGQPAQAVSGREDFAL